MIDLPSARHYASLAKKLILCAALVATTTLLPTATLSEEFNMPTLAGAISDALGLVSDGRVEVNTASIAVVEPTRHTPEEYDENLVRFYPDTPSEVIPLAPVQNVIVHIAEAAYRGEELLDAAFERGNETLRIQTVRGLALPRLLEDIENAGAQVVDEDGAVIEQPAIRQVENFLRETDNGGFFDARMEQYQQLAVERFGDNFIFLFQFNGFRHISFIEGLADELRGHGVYTDKLRNPQNDLEAEIQLLADTIEQAAPCIRETDMVALGFDAEQQEEGHAQCEQLGREIGQILVRH